MINRHFPQRHRMRWQNYDYTLGGACVPVRVAPQGRIRRSFPRS